LDTGQAIIYTNDNRTAQAHSGEAGIAKSANRRIAAIGAYHYIPF
jgi:hypothetical protein